MKIKMSSLVNWREYWQLCIDMTANWLRASQGAGMLTGDPALLSGYAIGYI
ncbi:hypothetical protein GCM10009022_41160 [Vreelandella titanicae]